MPAQHKALIVIVGPTAAGKTTLAIRLAQHFNTEIISADARQFYKEMNIGTAKPTADELRQAKHHLINSLSVRDHYDVSHFEKDALKQIEDIFTHHDTAILVGGSGFYIDVVCDGLDQLPPSENELRAELKRTLNEKGIEALQQQLKVLDPEYYSYGDLLNPRRLIRAIEVCLLTGKKYSSFRVKEKAIRPFKIIKVGISIPKEKLYERINARVDEMIANGLVEEVTSLLPYRHLNALNTVGYKELFDVVTPKGFGTSSELSISLADAVEKIKQNTRNYAKRQLTWFKKDKDITWFEPEKEEEIIHFIESKR